MDLTTERKMPHQPDTQDVTVSVTVRLTFSRETPTTNPELRFFDILTPAGTLLAECVDATEVDDAFIADLMTASSAADRRKGFRTDALVGELKGICAAHGRAVLEGMGS